MLIKCSGLTALHVPKITMLQYKASASYF